MKKLTILYSFLLALCTLAGCSNSNTETIIEPVVEPEITEEWTGLNENKIENSTETPSDSIIELYEKEWKITCTINGIDETLWNVESIIYIDGKDAYQELEIKEDEDTIKLYGLILDGNNYSRWDLYWEWNGVVIAEEQTVEEILYTYDIDSQNGAIDINCKAWIEWAKIEIPNNIEFADLSTYTE